MQRKKVLIGVSLGIVFVFSVLLISMAFLSKSTYSLLDNHVRVAEDSELTYYLDVIYDGKDRNLVMSSDDAIADVRSDYIYIEDKIPNGLTFIGFVNSIDGSIGAVRRNDNTTSCGGYIVDGINGLSYNEDTRTVSFRIKNLQAGCKLTVGIITRTPTLGDKKRMDFYNTAFGREDSSITNSNTVHVYLGRDNIDLYTVTYSYTGEVPTDAPGLPDVESFAEGATVGVINDISIPGYTFSGWQSNDVTIQSSSFTMPASNVVLTGSFTKNQTYSVTYSISGTDMPSGYRPPKDKQYSAGEEVNVDSLKPGDVISGYKFLGWETSDVEVNSDGVFSMPTKPVTFVGRFERVKYKVTYQFTGTILPPNPEALLPTEKSYTPGTTVTLEADPVFPGYRFLGWYKADTFEMPEEDVVIYGEWMQQTGIFSPVITKTIANPSPTGYYHSGDRVIFNIVVTNPESFAIHDVILQEPESDVSFISGTDYTVLNGSHVRIDSIPAGGSIIVQAEYTVGDQHLAELTRTVSLIGALADNNYGLDTSKEYKASATFKIANISLQIIKKDQNNVGLEGAEFTLYQDENCTQIIKAGLLFDRLLPNQIYYLKETQAPTGYVRLNGTLSLTVDATGVVHLPGYTVDGTNGKYSVVIFNQKINILPDTGGIGVVPFVIGGVIIMVGSAVGCVYFVNKKNGGAKRAKKNKK